jgi:hypothetical protein
MCKGNVGFVLCYDVLGLAYPYSALKVLQTKLILIYPVRILVTQIIARAPNDWVILNSDV